MSTRAQWLAVGGIIGGLAALLATGVAFTGDLASVSVGAEAPDFTAVDLQTGEQASLASHRGEVILLNVWATWCLPCEKEMPSMQRLYDQLGPQGLRVIAVSIDDAAPDAVREWIAERNLTFPVWHDQSGRIERLYQTTGVPESFVIDRHGVIVKKVIGATEWDHPAQQALIKRLLAGEPAEPADRDGG
ncbi:MAG TPA: TlpA disulfide reductase family protein [Gemmatimonadales bacterium]|nr:TlpA disulfide reductase family protein [Gemmatimonadales bacterium]